MNKLMKVVAALSFSKNGKYIASYTTRDNVIRIWQPQTGLFGSLMGAFQAHPQDPSGGALARGCVNVFTVGPSLSKG